MSLLKDETKFLTSYIVSNVKEHKLINLNKSQKLSTSMKSRLEKVDPRVNKSFQFGDQSNIFNNTQVDANHVVFETGLVKLDAFLNQLKKKKFDDKFSVLTDIEAFFKEIVTFYEHKLQDTKTKCNKEMVKIRADPTFKMMEKGSLSNFFESCVEKVRTLIARRKIEYKHNNILYDKKKKKTGDEMMDPKVTEADFMATDKLKILELFINNATVLKLLKYLVFWSYE